MQVVTVLDEDSIIERITLNRNPADHFARFISKHVFVNGSEQAYRWRVETGRCR